MKTIHRASVLAFIVLVVATSWEGDSAEVKKDQAQLQGEWTMVSGERAGTPFQADFMKDSKRVATGGEVTVTLQGALFMKATFKLDPSTSPKTIDYAVTGGPNAGKTQLGIYQIEGDKVKFCFSTPGQERPTTFTTGSGDGRTLSTWVRLKKPPSPSP
jgi:uncharacterized protein (TIGR03067 family)